MGREGGWKELTHVWRVDELVRGREGGSEAGRQAVRDFGRQGGWEG